MPVIANSKSYLRLLRIKDWRAFFLMFFFGFILSKGYLFSPLEIALFWAMVFSFLGFGFSINDHFDTKEDALHQDKEKLLVGKKVSRKNSLIFSGALLASGLVLAAFLGLNIFVFSLIILSASLFYSAPPLRMKSRPFLDLISHGFFWGALLFILPLLVFNAEMRLLHFLIAFSIFYISALLELRNHLEDFEADKGAGLNTTACFLGYENSERALRYLAIFCPLFLFPIFLLAFPQYLVLFLILTIVFSFFFLLSKDNRMGKNYRILDGYSLASFALLTAAIF